MNSYSKPNESRKPCNIALLWFPKLSWVPNGSGICVNGLFKCSIKLSGLGILSGTLRRPSMSSEKATNLLGISQIRVSAFRTIVVRNTSPNVPICGNPDGPYPVSRMMQSLSKLALFRRFVIFRASSNGHARALLRISSEISVLSAIVLFLLLTSTQANIPGWRRQVNSI